MLVGDSRQDQTHHACLDLQSRIQSLSRLVTQQLQKHDIIAPFVKLPAHSNAPHKKFDTLRIRRFVARYVDASVAE